MKELMRQKIKELKPYHAPHITEGIKLDANENIYPVPVELKMHMSKWALSMPINYYPDTDSTKLRSAIAKAYGVQQQQVLVGVGSDQLIDCILRAFVEKGETVVVPKPSFSMYGLSVQLNEGKLVEVALNDNFTYDVEALVETVKIHAPKVTFLCHPNNPTGTPMAKSAIKKILDVASGVVVVDEAYGEFCKESALDLVKDYPQLVVLKTFSKAYGLAGARIGYAIAQPCLIECLHIVKPPYNINAFTEELACYVIENRHLFQERIKKITNTCQWVSSQLSVMGFEVAPTATNFLWVKSDLPLDKILKTFDIYIKKFEVNNESYYRISMGTDDQMLKIVQRMSEIKGV